jgi:uncharacterized membrane protein
MPSLGTAGAAGLVIAAAAVALALRPWRGLSAAGPPWPWLAACALMPLAWSADRLGGMPMVQPLSGACLLVLMAGWPLAVLALVGVAAVTAWLVGLEAAAALERLLWLGLAPATLALLLGAALRRFAPRHLFVYILGRGFFVTLLALTLAGAARTALGAAPEGLEAADVMLARWLAAWADAIITGMLVAIFVAFRPAWLATYADRLYLPRSTS